MIKGRVHSVQSLGTVDGPGIRFIVFMQGCPLRCIYCHNPDTWKFDGGNETTVDELIQQISRCTSYFGKDGGVTVSGGEPLLQAPFVTELFKKLHELNINTALDTSGIGNLDQARELLKYTDLILMDIKFVDDEDYEKYVKCKLSQVKKFLDLAQEMDVPFWARHVVVPGINDTVEDMQKIYDIAKGYKNFRKIEWLAFRKFCNEKYHELEIEFPLENTPQMNQKILDELDSKIKK